MIGEVNFGDVFVLRALVLLVFALPVTAVLRRVLLWCEA